MQLEDNVDLKQERDEQEGSNDDHEISRKDRKKHKKDKHKHKKDKKKRPEFEHLTKEDLNDPNKL